MEKNPLNKRVVSERQGFRKFLLLSFLVLLTLARTEKLGRVGLIQQE